MLKFENIEKRKYLKNLKIILYEHKRSEEDEVLVFLFDRRRLLLRHFLAWKLELSIRKTVGEYREVNYLSRGFKGLQLNVTLQSKTSKNFREDRARKLQRRVLLSWKEWSRRSTIIKQLNSMAVYFFRFQKLKRVFRSLKVFRDRQLLVNICSVRQKLLKK